MKTIQPNGFLRGVLLVDALVSSVVAVAHIALGETLAALFGLAHELLIGTGFFLVGYVVLLVVLARAPRLWAAWVRLVVIGNVAWALGCVALATIAATQTTALGLAFLAAQAGTVLTFAALEYRGLVDSVGSPRPAWAS